MHIYQGNLYGRVINPNADKGMKQKGNKKDEKLLMEQMKFSAEEQKGVYTADGTGPAAKSHE